MVYNYNNAAIRICVDRQTEGQISGRIFSPLLSQPVYYTDIGNMFLLIEEFLDTTGFPCAFQKLRSFVPAGSACKLGSFVFNQTPASVDGMRGALVSFDLRITSRQNASWQGMLEYDGEKRRFRSALELIKMMYPLVILQEEIA